MVFSEQSIKNPTKYTSGRIASSSSRLRGFLFFFFFFFFLHFVKKEKTSFPFPDGKDKR